MSPKTYSNGAENLDADFLMMSGTQVSKTEKQEQASSIKCKAHFVRTRVRTEKRLSMYLTWKEQSSFPFWKIQQERFYLIF